MSEASKYRKRPVIVEAIHFDGTEKSALEVLNWAAIFAPDPVYIEPLGDRSEWKVVVDTLEGTMTANAGDYIIRGVQGEFYPCKPDIFRATYEPA